MAFLYRVLRYRKTNPVGLSPNIKADRERRMRRDRREQSMSPRNAGTILTRYADAILRAAFGNPSAARRVHRILATAIPSRILPKFAGWTGSVIVSPYQVRS